MRDQTLKDSIYPMLAIRLYGDPILRQKAVPVPEVNDAVRDFIQQMGATMYFAEGIGLAANQVGDPRHILVADAAQVEGGGPGRRIRNESKRQLRAFINAEILESSDEDGPYSEGCLSIPVLEGEIWRPLRIRVKYQDETGAAHDEWFDGLLARVLQHELDHLDGKLFIDRMTDAARVGMAGDLGRIRRGDVKVKYPVVVPAPA